MKITTKLGIGLGMLILLSPLGLLLPEYFKAGPAWGEWGIDKVCKLAGYAPQGMKKLSGFWNAPIPDYVFRGWEETGLRPGPSAGSLGGGSIYFPILQEKGLPRLSFAYIISAITGVILVVLLVLVIGKLLAKKGG